LTLHVTNGDATAGTLRRTSLGGTVVAWRDVLHEGPVPPGDDDAVRRARAHFLASAGFEESTVLAELEARDAALLDALRAGDDVVLWFEHDLYDQLQLVQALTLVERSGVPKGTLRLICVDRFEGRTDFAGLSELDAAELESLWPLRSAVQQETFAAAAEVWDAFRSDDPRAVEARSRQHLPGLPFLAAALMRLLEELPAVDDGLARSERQLLRALAAGATTIADLLIATYDDEEAPFLGDLWLGERLDRISRGPRPLVVGRWRLTENGRAVLAGDLDAVDAVGVDRWLGGTHVHGRRPWRWDRAACRVVAPR
jgi:Domain of unknown function (DUF1835)